MKVTIDRDELAKGLAGVKAAVATRTTIPALASVLLEAVEGGGLVLTANDTEIQCRRTLDAAVVSEPGTALVDCGKLVQTVALADEGELVLTTADDMLTLRQSFNEQALPTRNADEFPVLTAGDSAGESFTLFAGMLARLLVLGRIAAAKEETTRFAIAGTTLLEIAKGQLTAASTDSKRLAICTATVEADKPGAAASALLPGKAVTTLAGVLAEGKVVVVLAPTSATFRGDGWEVVTRLVSGRYPPYRDIIPKKAPHKVALDPAAFLAKVRQAANMTDDETKRIDFEFGDGKVRMTSRAAKAGKAVAELSLPGLGDVDLNVSLDPAFVIDFLRVVDEPSITMEATDGGKPILFTAGENYRYVVMPLAG